MKFSNEAEFLAFLNAEIEANRVVLPTLPEVALKVRDAVNKGEASAVQLAEIIGSDAALSARLIQVANSPLYRGRVEIEKLQMAIPRLGNNTVRTLVTSLVMQQIFNPQSPLLEKYFRKTWEDGINVAAMSRAFASRCSHLDADQAMLGGLIHQIGKLPVLTVAENHSSLLEDKAAFENLLNSTHSKIGGTILKSWEFPESLINVVLNYNDFSRDAGNDADYVDVVQVAYLENMAATAPEVDQADWSTIPAFGKLGLAAEIEVLEIEGVAEEVEEAHRLLS